MSSNDTLSNIGIQIEPRNANKKLHWQRRALQILTILVAFLIPITGLLRIDPVAGAFIVLGRQIWWSDFFIVFGLWLLIASSLVLIYSKVGTAFCGWSCPQNSLSEWANHLTHKLLGKRADVSLEGQKMPISAKKNTWLNWLILSLFMILASLIFALLPLIYFYEPAVIWSFVTFQNSEKLAPSLYYIYTIFVLIILLDVAFIRHFWCRFMCIYKVWQHGFKTKNTLRVSYDESRAAQCEKCNYCYASCFLGIDPKKTNTYDSCINCGECISACNNLQAKKGQTGLLSFKVGNKKVSRLGLLIARGSELSTRVKWTFPFLLLGLMMFVWGLISYESYHISVYRADINQGAEIRDYRIAISNKIYRRAQFDIEIEGLPVQSYQLSNENAQLTQAGRVDVNMHITASLKPGLHSFLVHVKSQDGWRGSYRVQHFVGRG